MLNASPNPLNNRLIVFSGVSHHIQDSRFIAHRGFVREIDIWARIFRDVVVVTRMGTGPVLSDDIPYTEQNIRVYPLAAPANTDGLIGKIKLAFYGPVWLVQSLKQLTDKDVLMARGPDSIGFLGWLVSRFCHLPRFAKYADQWDGFSGEPIGYRLQKIFYKTPKFGGPVMIYGASDPRRSHLVPFFTSGVTTQEWNQAGKMIQQRKPPPPFRLLFVGRFVYFKGIDVLLDAMKILNTLREDFILDLVGDGPEKERLLHQIEQLGLKNITLHGWLGAEELSNQYTQAHIFIHPSRKEGFGKVLIEAMSYGLPIIGADVGVSRELVDKNHCGLLFKNGDAVHLAHQLNLLLSSSDQQTEMARHCRRISQQLVLENLEKRYREFSQIHLGSQK